MGPLQHFSEDPGITRFVPHVPVTNPGHRPAVWAMDEEHAPLYWFPRDCPRVTVWPRDEVERTAFRTAFTTDAWRLHAMELTWLERMRTTTLYRYLLPAERFAPWADATGQWICEHEVEPIAVEPVGDLPAAHVAAYIELRIVPSLRPLRDAVIDGTWDFSIVRMANAAPRC
ncbi:MAG: DUF6886 family protein [Ilumatobacteraceae bacterium]